MTGCAHTRQFAWVVYDPIQEGDYVCIGCCVCGAALCGAVVSPGNPVGPQHRLGPKKKKRKKKGGG